MSECITCKEFTTKYKCPQCLEYYCSVPCYKTHKESPDCKPKAKAESNTGQPCDGDEEEPTLLEPFSTEDTVPRDKLAKLANCEPLHNLLYNPHLRNLLREIDVAPNAWNAMRAAMQEPLFVEFADECLKVVEPLSEEE